MKEHRDKLAVADEDKFVTIGDVQSLSESPRAVLVYAKGREHWIPKSQIHDESEVYERDQWGDLIITKWIAKERGLWEGDDNS